MEISNKFNVNVDRQLVESESVDLPQFLDSVYTQMLRNFSLFGAEEKFDIWPEEVTLSHVVVYNGKTRTYTRATIVKDDQGDVTGFGDIEQVKREWVPIDGSVERQAPFDVVVMERKSIWGGIV